MDKAKYFLGIDTGTQSVRVAVADISGNIVASDEQEYGISYPKPGWAEQKPSDWWESFSKALKNVTDQLSVGIRQNIQSVSVCSTSSTVLAVDEKCNSLMDAIMWMDTRAVKEMESINATKDPILEYCGGEDSVEWMIPKTLWIKNNMPEIYKKAYKIIEQLDWMNYQLCGTFATSICQAACKWNYVSCEGGWNGDFFNKIGLDDWEDKLVTDVKRLGETLGKIRPELATKYGLNPDMIVVQGGIDAHIGMLGLGVAKPGKMAMIMGSSFVQLAFAESEEKMKLEGIWGPYNEPVVPGAWLLEGGQISAGSIVKWFMREFEIDKMDNPYGYLAGLLKDTQPGANGLVALDFFQGNRTPFKDPSAKGVIYGLSLSHTRAEIYRALLESVALGTKNIIDNFERQGCPIDKVVGCGGITKDADWMQIIADATGKPIVVTVDPSAGALGCTLVAAVGAGAYKDFDSAAQGMIKEAYTVEPNPDNYGIYQKLFDTYIELYNGLKDTMHKN